MDKYMDELKCNKLIINFDNSDSLIIPYENQRYIYSYILKQLEIEYSEISYNIHNTKIPYFVMSQLIPSGGTKFNTLGIKSKRFVLIINSYKEDLIKIISNYFKPGSIITNDYFKLYTYSSYILQPKFDDSFPELVSRSPIILKDETNKYVGFGDSNFEDSLKRNIENKCKKITGKDKQINGLNIIYGKRKISHIHNIPIISSVVKFVVDASPDLIKTALCVGIGKNTQMGYGMVDIND